MTLYLYLTDLTHTKAWIEGGDVPIAPARQYRGPRGGTSTPDEVIQRQTRGIDGEAFAAVNSIIGVEGAFDFVSFENCAVATDARPHYPLNALITAQEEDSLIFCFSEVLSRETLDKFNKMPNSKEKVCAVRIVNPALLVEAVSPQIGARGFLEPVEYTDSPDRSHVLKSIEDEWQAEVRAYWPLPTPPQARWVTLPSGIGDILVTKAEMPEKAPPPRRRRVAPVSVDAEWSGAPGGNSKLSGPAPRMKLLLPSRSGLLASASVLAMGWDHLV